MNWLKKLFFTELEPIVLKEPEVFLYRCDKCGRFNRFEYETYLEFISENLKYRANCLGCNHEMTYQHVEIHKPPPKTLITKEDLHFINYYEGLQQLKKGNKNDTTI